jgi:hypothetical protein
MQARAQREKAQLEAEINRLTISLHGKLGLQQSKPLVNIIHTPSPQTLNLNLPAVHALPFKKEHRRKTLNLEP